MSDLLIRIAVGLWSLVCGGVCVALLGFFLASHLKPWWAAVRTWPRRIRAARVHSARHRITTVEETPVFDMPEIIRDLINRQRQDPQEGRGRHWAVDALHGETMALPVVVLPSAVDGELVAVSAEPALAGA